MIHPRRLTGRAGNIARYYSVGDYYTKGGDEPSAWGGKIADELGLEGQVYPKLFEALLAGQVGDQQLGRHRKDGTIEHHPGWDFAVNAPKSVSIMALVMGDERILAAHERAVSVALDYLEEHAELRRRDSGEIVHETTGRLLWARFTEHASRELDPHLHTHVVVLNMTNGEAGLPMASLETRAMFVEQMTAGQIYRNELAHLVREAGYGIDIDPRSGLFEISGVSPALAADMSRRAEKIDAHAKEHGLQGQAARRRSFYETRGPKEKVGLDDLHGRWTARSQAHRSDLDKVQADAAARGEQALAPDPRASARALLFGIRQSGGREAVNNLGLIYRQGLASYVGEVRLDDIRPLADDHQQRAKLLRTREQTGDLLLTRGRTTRRTARLELKFAYQLALAIDDARPVATPDRIASVLEEAGLNPAQEHALRLVGLGIDRLAGVDGVAGSGKSTLVKALVAAAEPDLRFLALAPTSSAAANLGGGAGIEARTVASLMASGGRDLDANDVLVLDEAGQLGNRQAERLLEISRLSGARLIFLGDEKQTGAIEQGKAFWLLQRLGLPTARLPEAVRQETRTMKAAVAQARLGDYRASLANLDRVVSGGTAEELAKGLVGEWTRLKPGNRAGTNILVLENATRLIVNTQVREALQREDVVSRKEVRLQILAPAGMTDEEKRFARFYRTEHIVRFARDLADVGLVRDTDYKVAGLWSAGGGRQMVRLKEATGQELRWDPRTTRSRSVAVFKAEERDLAVGERIQWRLATSALDLKNAERGTVEALDGTVATIRWDRGGRQQTVDLSVHKSWDLGYAETVYSAQSKTYDRVYVLAPVASPLVNGRNYYTAITRARFGVKLWTEDVDKLADRLDRNSGEKSSALEGLGRVSAKDMPVRPSREGAALDRWREETRIAREARQERRKRSRPKDPTPASRLAEGAREIAERLATSLGADRNRGAAHEPNPDRAALGIDR